MDKEIIKLEAYLNKASNEKIVVKTFTTTQLLEIRQNENGKK
jgi:hypothetical protein